MQSIKHAIISAAGLGSRLGMDIPKCLLPLGNHKLIYYQLQLLADVPDVRVVVGFREHEVMEYVSRLRKDVLFVRNPSYMETSTLQSIYMACHNLSNPFIAIDGDLLIESNSFKEFLNTCNESEEAVIGYCKSTTSDPVYITLNDKKNKILKFQRNCIMPYEWCGIAYLTNDFISNANAFLYHQLEPYLPLSAKEINCYEIDTPDDLKKLNSSSENWVKAKLYSNENFLIPIL